jgi:DamX protein
MENTPDTAALADQIASLSDDLARHRLEFQAAESALVTRIADVDDDRRLTTNRLQRAWQTHHEEIDARLKHQVSVFAGALLLVAALLGGALFFAYGQLDAARRALLEDVARLRVDYEQLAAVAAQDAALQEGLADLRASVAAMSESLPPRGEVTEPQAQTEESASTDQVQVGPSPEPTNETEPTEDKFAMTAEEIPSASAKAKSAPITQAVPDAETEASPSAAAIRDETAPAPTHTPEDLAGQDAEPAAEPSPETVPEAPPEPDPASEATPSASPTGDPSPPDEDAPPPSIEPVARTLEANTGQTQSVSARILDESLTVGNTPFALQLIGFYSLDELLDFARREELPSRVYFREESYQGRPWFVLIHSLYAGYSDASAAIDRLPTQLAILDTWIRSFPPQTRLGILDIGR